DIAWIISHNEVLFSHILPEIQASFKDLKQFLNFLATVNRIIAKCELFMTFWHKILERTFFSSSAHFFGRMTSY
ncbi:hypothetical protein EFO83_12145, partial [Lacticaseibacillus rhamnosus]|uniref:hypothetical protein n=1 Tax=Lacticaseibacillus rhamnosus TaxID=47715 RepID=UPI0021A3A69D